MKNKNIVTCLFLSVCMISLWGESSFNNMAEEMDAYTEGKRIQWSFNPYDRPYTDKSFTSWTDPLAYNSYWYMYYPPLEAKSFNKKDYKLDNVLFYHSPQLGATLSPIAFYLDKMKYRFYIGVGFLWNGYFLMYGNNATQYYGTHLFLNSVIQVEPYIDFIYKDNLRLRLTPIRHICYHMSGDILGDGELYKEEEHTFRDVGFEQIHTSVSYRWGWFNLYGGIAGAVTHFEKSNLVNLLYFYGGTEMRLPLYGEVNLIAGFHIGGNYDRINEIQRVVEGNQYNCISSRYELTPIISGGVGLGIYDWVIGLKIDYGRSRQIYAYDNMDLRIGLSACLLL